MFDDDRHDIEMDDTTGRYIVWEREQIGNFANMDEAKRFIEHRKAALRFPKLLPRGPLDDIGE
jgi:hypothetical protein